MVARLARSEAQCECCLWTGRRGNVHSAWQTSKAHEPSLHTFTTSRHHSPLGSRRRTHGLAGAPEHSCNRAKKKSCSQQRDAKSMQSEVLFCWLVQGAPVACGIPRNLRSNYWMKLGHWVLDLQEHTGLFVSVSRIHDICRQKLGWYPSKLSRTSTTRYASQNFGKLPKLLNNSWVLSQPILTTEQVRNTERLPERSLRRTCRKSNTEPSEIVQKLQFFAPLEQLSVQKRRAETGCSQPKICRHSPPNSTK